MEASVSRYLGIRAGVGRPLVACGALLLSGCLQHWDRLSRPDVGFEVSMPGTMICSPADPHGVDERARTSNSCSSAAFSRLWEPLGQATYEVTWSDVRLSEQAQAGGVTEGPCGLVEESIPPKTRHSAKLGGQEGVECSWEKPFSAAATDEFRARHRFVSRARCANHGGRVFCVEITGVLNPRLERLWDEVSASFRFTSAQT